MLPQQSFIRSPSVLTIFVLCSFWLFLFASLPNAWTQVQLSDFEARVFTNSVGGTLPYRLFIPKNYNSEKKYPLVTFLHGKGRKGNDNRKQVALGAKAWAHPQNQEVRPCFVMAPQTPVEESWRNMIRGKAKMPPIKTVLEILDHLEKEFSIDKDREYITGQSGGGTGSWSVLLLQPDRFAAAAIVCAGYEFSAEDQAKVIKHFKDFPLWLFHGDKDQLVPVERSRAKVKMLKEAGGSPKYTEYPGVRHNSWEKAYRERELWAWLFSQSRKSEIN